MILASTSDILRLITASAVTVDVQASWSDQTTTAFTPGRTNTAITTATTTTVLGSPAASTQRIVQSLKIRNKHASSSNLVTLEHYDGTTAVEIVKYTLLAGELLQYDGREFTLFDATGAIKTAGGGGASDGLNRISAGTQIAGTLATVSFADSNGISFGMSDSSVITASHNGLTSQSNQNVTAGNGGFAFQTLSFSNVNGFSFGTSAGSAITGSYTVPTETPFGVSAGTQSVSTGTLVFSNSNGVTFGMSGSSRVTASHDGLTSQSNQNVTAGNGGFAFQTLSFSNVNGFSFGTSAGSAITGSYTVPTETPFGVSAGTQSVSTGTLVFSNSNGITFGMSGSSRVTASHDGLTSQSNQNVTAGNGGFAFQTLSFSNVNGFSFGTSAGSAITGSYTVPTQSNQQMTLFATGNTTLSSTGTSNASSLIFRGSGAASVGITAGSILIDVAAGAAAITQSFGISTQTAGGATAGTSGYVTGDDILYHLVPGSNITMSQSVNGASGTLSIYGPAAGGGATLSGWNPFDRNEFVSNAGGQASLFISQLNLPAAMQFDRFALTMTLSNATNSSGSGTISVWVGLSTRNVSSLSSVASTSFTTAFTMSGTAGSYSNYGGIKMLPVPWTTTLGASNYWLGVVSRTTTGGANMTIGNMVNSQAASTMSGYFGSGSNATNAQGIGVGVYSVTTAGMPTAISLTQINGNSSAFQRHPAYQFMSSIF